MLLKSLPSPGFVTTFPSSFRLVFPRNLSSGFCSSNSTHSLRIKPSLLPMWPTLTSVPPACLTHSVLATLTFHLSFSHTHLNIISFASKGLYPEFTGQCPSYSAFPSSIVSPQRTFLATRAEAISATTPSSPPILFMP